MFGIGERHKKCKVLREGVDPFKSWVSHSVPKPDWEQCIGNAATRDQSFAGYDETQKN
jgi:hypothetical protein